MITAQDIQEKVFETSSRFTEGYDKDSVDVFLDELAEEFSAAQKENAVLKSKMKVLVDKIEEYRANEEALNLAVLSAQKLAVQIESDARTRAAAMIADAERQVKAQIGSISDQAKAEEDRLAKAKADTAAFVAQAGALIEQHLKSLDKVGKGLDLEVKEEPAPAPAAEEEKPSPSLGSTQPFTL